MLDDNSDEGNANVRVACPVNWWCLLSGWQECYTACDCPHKPHEQSQEAPGGQEAARFFI